MKKPRMSGPRRSRKSPHDIPACLEHDSFLVQALVYEPPIDPPHVLTTAERSVLARNEATLHRSDLTAEEAGDALLAITETKQLRVRVRNFGGAVVDELQLPTLGLALLLESAIGRRKLRCRAGGTAPANHQQVGADAASLPTCSAPRLPPQPSRGHINRAPLSSARRGNPRRPGCVPCMRNTPSRSARCRSVHPMPGS